MKKLSSKIIISLLLAVLLWGVGLFISKTTSAYVIGGSTCISGTSPYLDKSNNEIICLTADEFRQAQENGENIVQDAEVTKKVAEADAATNKKVAEENKVSGLKNNSFSDAWQRLIRKMLGDSKTADFAAGLIGSIGFKTWTLILYSIKVTLSVFVWLAATLLDASMVLSIQHFKIIAESSGLEVGWQIIRDFLNISFIFIMLYISISMIIGNFGIKKKSTVASVVIAALLINFSLFFTRIVIDLGNQVAVALSNQTGGAIGGLSALVIQGTGFVSVIGGIFTDWTLGAQTATIALLTFQIVLQAIVLWAFLSAAFLFIGRMIALIVLMTLSPIGFIGDAIPWLKEKSTEWKSALIGQVMVAPVFMFFLVLVTTLLEAKSKANLSTLANESLKGATGYADTGAVIGEFVFFAIVMTMLITGVKMTKKLSGSVAGFVDKIINTGLALILAAITGGAATLATRGMGMAARGARAMEVGATRGGASGARLEMSGRIAARRGQALQAVGNLFSGQTASNIMNQPGMVGRSLTAARDSLFKTAKKETGVDLKYIVGARKAAEEEDEKRYAKEAARIGGDKEKKELDTLEKINKNIEGQAKKQAEEAHKIDKERVTAMPSNDPTERAAKKAAIDSLNATIKSETKALMPAIAKKLGVDLKDNEDRQKGLKIIIEQKQVNRDKYVSKLGKSFSASKKSVANKLRTSQNYEVKDSLTDNLDKAIKEWMKKNPQSTSTPPPTP